MKPYGIRTTYDGARIIRVTALDSCLTACGKYIPVGYTCDGASVPWWLMWIFRDLEDEKYIPSFIRHDYIYEHCLTSRRRADDDLAAELVALGYSPIKACLIYWAVRIFGFTHWGNM